MSASGSIYDLGYQRYDGPRLGRLAVTRGLLRASLAAAYGIGRGGRAKIAPFTFAVLGLVPAVVAVGIVALAAQAGAGEAIEEAGFISHANYQGIVGTFVTLFLAAQAPELFGRDQRYGTLPLFFSRLLTRTDYAMARLGGLVLAVLLVSLVPHLVLTVGAALGAADPVAGLSEDAADIPRYIAITVVSSVLLSSVATVIAAWTPRRAYATAGIIAAFLIPSVIVLIVSELLPGDTAGFVVLASPSDVVDGLNAAIFGTVPDSPAVSSSGLPDWAFAAAAAVWIVALLAVILRRYQTLDT